MTQSILSVDDSAAMRQIISASLGEAGYRVSTASDGAAALERAREEHFDLVLTDQHMPGMDGLALIRALRALPGYGSAPILVLTTEVDAAYKEAARAAGASGWLLKPVDPAMLIEVVGALLGASAASIQANNERG
ncbi:MAG: response regulator [Burkholderiales bacterium]|nr:response regulator [Burkholderiales bacterium]MDE2288374.1 response regulator [Burkholderiales bacterium]MDE2609755.1 response regulator [Burkholderiales bacterium]